MREVIVEQYLNSEEICIELKKSAENGEIIRVRSAKKAKRLFNRNIDKKKKTKKLKEVFQLREGLNKVSKKDFLKVVAKFIKKKNKKEAA